MKPVALALLVLLGASCGVFNDGNRRYACRSNNDCLDTDVCIGVEQVARGEKGCPGTPDGGVPYYFHDGDDHCYYLYCLPDDKAECNGDKCASGSQCALRASGGMGCIEEDVVLSATPCEDWVAGSCNGDSTGECVISFRLVAERFKDTIDDPFKAKVCASFTSIHF